MCQTADGTQYLQQNREQRTRETKPVAGKVSRRNKYYMQGADLNARVLV